MKPPTDPSPPLSRPRTAPARPHPSVSRSGQCAQREQSPLELESVSPQGLVANTLTPTSARFCSYVSFFPAHLIKQREHEIKYKNNSTNFVCCADKDGGQA